jgi:DNA-binding response OmpR family regulator
MQSEAVRLVRCPRCLGSDVYLSRPQTDWDSVLLPVPLRCRSCAKRFYKRLDLTQLRMRTAIGGSHGPVPAVLPIAGPRAPGVLVVDDGIPFSKAIRETLAGRGLAVFGAKTPAYGLALFRAHQPQIDLALIGLVTPSAGNLDLAADLNHLRPGLPVLYLVGAIESIARCSIEAQAPGSVLAVPFTEEQLIARVGGLLDAEAAARQMLGERLWDRLIAASDWIPSGTAMFHVYELRHAGLAKGHAATLRDGNVQYTFRATNCEAAPYSMTVRAQDVTHARWLIGQAPVGRRSVEAA